MHDFLFLDYSSCESPHGVYFVGPWNAVEAVVVPCIPADEGSSSQNQRAREGSGGSHDLAPTLPSLLSALLRGMIPGPLIGPHCFLCWIMKPGEDSQADGMG